MTIGRRRQAVIHCMTAPTRSMEPIGSYKASTARSNRQSPFHTSHITALATHTSPSPNNTPAAQVSGRPVDSPLQSVLLIPMTPERRYCYSDKRLDADNFGRVHCKAVATVTDTSTHSLIIAIHGFFGPPVRRPSFTVPCSIVSSSVSCREAWSCLPSGRTCSTIAAIRRF